MEREREMAMEIVFIFTYKGHIILPHMTHPITPLHNMHSLSQAFQSRAVVACSRTQEGLPPVRKQVRHSTYIHYSASSHNSCMRHCHTST